MPEDGDIAFDSAAGTFRLRSVGVAFDGTRVLLHTLDGADYWLLPGGKVRLGEASARGVRRRMARELGAARRGATPRDARGTRAGRRGRTAAPGRGKRLQLRRPCLPRRRPLPRDRRPDRP